MVRSVKYFTCPGNAVAQCKDVVYFRENGEYAIYALADGLNSKDKSHIGARMIQRSAADLFEDFDEMFFEESLAMIKGVMIEIIRDVLYNLSKEKGSREEYASTMMIVFVSLKHNAYRWLHIGDGIIATEDVNGKMEVVSRPHNGITKQHTFTTDSEPLDRYLHMDSGSLEDIAKIMLLTDGAIDMFYREGDLTVNGKEFLGKGADVFCKILEPLHVKDDHSMLEVSFNIGG